MSITMKLVKASELPRNKPIDAPAQVRVTLNPEMREYYVEKRRALLTELKALNKLLGIKSE